MHKSVAQEGQEEPHGEEELERPERSAEDHWADQVQVTKCRREGVSEGGSRAATPKSEGGNRTVRYSVRLTHAVRHIHLSESVSCISMQLVCRGSLSGPYTAGSH